MPRSPADQNSKSARCKRRKKRVTGGRLWFTKKRSSGRQMKKRDTRGSSIDIGDTAKALYPILENIGADSVIESSTKGSMKRGRGSSSRRNNQASCSYRLTCGFNPWKYQLIMACKFDDECAGK